MEEKVIEINRVYNVPEAANLLGVHNETIKEFCRLGTLQCKKIGEWKILGKALIDFMTTDHPQASPPGLTLRDGTPAVRDTSGVPPTYPIPEERVIHTGGAVSFDDVADVFEQIDKLPISDKAQFVDLSKKEKKEQK